MGKNYFNQAGDLGAEVLNQNSNAGTTNNTAVDVTGMMDVGYCPSCGAAVSGGAQFCANCGCRMQQPAVEKYDPAGYPYQPAPSQTTDPAVNQSFPQRIDNLADSISKKKRINAGGMPNNAGAGYGMPTYNGSYVLVKKKSAAKTLIVVGSVLAVLATIAAIVFFAMGGMLRVRLSGKWYLKNRRGEVEEILRFGYWGKGSQQDTEDIFDSTAFKWSLDKDKDLVITIQGGIFGGYTENFKWDAKAKDISRSYAEDYWYLEGDTLYVGGDMYTR